MHRGWGALALALSLWVRPSRAEGTARLAADSLHATAEPSRAVGRVGPSRRRASRTSSAATPLGRSLARRAARLVGHRSLRDVSRAFPDDCSGFVRYVYARAGLDPLGPGESRPGASVAAELYRRAPHRRPAASRPRPGDLVFFHDTYDRNRDGLVDDGITHVGLVESVAPDGRVTFIHRASKGIVRSHLDARHPTVRRDARRRVRNDVLRARDRKRRERLAGELLVGFAGPAS